MLQRRWDGIRSSKARQGQQVVLTASIRGALHKAATGHGAARARHQGAAQLGSFDGLRNQKLLIGELNADLESHSAIPN